MALHIQVYHITRENLVVLTVSQPMAEVEARLDELRRLLWSMHNDIYIVSYCKCMYSCGIYYIYSENIDALFYVNFMFSIRTIL